MNVFFNKSLRLAGYMVLLCWMNSCVFLGLLEGNRELVITDEYIQNEHWYEYNRSFSISKLIPKHAYITNLTIDSIKGSHQPFMFKNFNEAEGTLRWAFLNETGERYSERRVYFNEFNGFNWYTYDTMHYNRKLGKLQPGNWYLFTHLFDDKGISCYVYVDNNSKCHIFRVSISNY